MTARCDSHVHIIGPIERYRELYPKIKVQIRRSLSSKVPTELLDGNLELGVISYDPADTRLQSQVIYTDALTFVVSPKHRLANRQTVSIEDWCAYLAELVVKHLLDEDEAREVARDLAYNLAKKAYKL